MTCGRPSLPAGAAKAKGPSQARTKVLAVRVSAAPLILVLKLRKP
jgi:hypothetical protein